MPPPAARDLRTVTYRLRETRLGWRISDIEYDQGQTLETLFAEGLKE